MEIDATYVRTLTDMAAFLRYLVSIYGQDLYLDKQRLYNLIADLYPGEKRIKILFRRAIVEENLAKRIYELSKKRVEERRALSDAIILRFAENNFLSKEVSQRVVQNLDNGLDVFTRLADGRWKDDFGCIYDKDKKKLLYAPKNLVQHSIPNGVTLIGESAFSGCTSLFSIHILDSVISIGWFAFSGCTSLFSIHIPDSVTFIGRGTFSGCTSLVSIHIPDGVKIIDWGLFEGCTSLSSIHIPDSVTSIGDCVFRGCTSLSSIHIPDSVTSIGESAFSGCTSLSSIHIPDGVKEIDRGAFSGCTSLSSIHIPDSVTRIEYEAFSNCPSIKYI